MSRSGVPPASFSVSVVIPLYNKADYIAETLDSVLRQSLPPLEILVIDDGSTDQGPEIVRSFNDPRIKLIEQRNQGPGQARNRGIAEAHGDWVAFIDADDLWLEDHLAELARLSQPDPEVPFLATSYRELGEPSTTGTKADSPPSERQDFFALPANSRNIWSSSVAVRTDILRSSGGFGPAWPGEDVDLWVRLGLDHPVFVTPRVTALYRRDTGGLTEQYFAGERICVPTFFGHLDRALGDDRYKDRHPLIRTYRDRWRRLLARQAILFGDATTAHRLLAEAETAPLARVVTRILSFLPARWLQHATQLARAAKNQLRNGSPSN